MRRAGRIVLVPLLLGIGAGVAPDRLAPLPSLKGLTVTLPTVRIDAPTFLLRARGAVGFDFAEEFR